MPPRVSVASVTVHPADSDCARTQFLELPQAIYSHDKNWVPPFPGYEERMVNYVAHPFFDHGEIQTFLARRGGHVVGRIAAIIDRDHLRRYADSCGFFGFFECVNDHHVARRLFAAAREWLRDRGASKIRGPVNPSMNYGCGILTHGFEEPPLLSMTYNPPYYPELIERCGLLPAHEMYAYRGTADQLPLLCERLGPLAARVRRFCGATIRPMSKRSFRTDVDRFWELHNASLNGHWGFVPPTKRELQTLAISLWPRLVPELVQFAEVGGRAVGVVVGLPDFNPRTIDQQNSSLEVGGLGGSPARQQTRQLCVANIHVLPEYQLSGIGLALLHGLTPTIDALGIQTTEFHWVSRDNFLARAGLEKCGAKISRVYKIYDSAAFPSAVARSHLSLAAAQIHPEPVGNNALA